MVKIAVAQIELFDEINKNLKKVLKFIDKASIKKADLVCFPESCLGEKFLEIQSKEIKIIQKKCKGKSIYCIFGCHLKENERIFNVAILIDRKGEIIYIYKKNHLFSGLDLKETSAGKTNKVLETDFGKIGIIICWDFAFSKEIKKLAQEGAKIIFCPSYLLNDAKISKEVFRSYPLTRAFESLCYFVSCDAFTNEVLSESYICSPLKILNTIQNKEGIIFADLDLNKITKLRKTYDCLE